MGAIRTGRNRRAGSDSSPRPQRLPTARGRVAPVRRAYKRLIRDLLGTPELNAFDLSRAAKLAPEDRGGLNLEGLAPRCRRSPPAWLSTLFPRDVYSLLRCGTRGVDSERRGVCHLLGRRPPGPGWSWHSRHRVRGRFPNLPDRRRRIRRCARLPNLPVDRRVGGRGSRDRRRAGRLQTRGADRDRGTRTDCTSSSC